MSACGGGDRRRRRRSKGGRGGAAGEIGGGGGGDRRRGGASGWGFFWGREREREGATEERERERVGVLRVREGWSVSLCTFWQNLLVQTAKCQIQSCHFSTLVFRSKMTKGASKWQNLNRA